ncbi:MAG: 30S ribosomal protein S21 [Puniceicoccales bacterium]|jgi:small subunit ribosomal protein S21|nr:30S ribosomal protein S21 [Puniceicoccales bacterium]
MAVAVQVRKGETVDKALRRLKKRLDREGVLKEVRDRRYFEKPCAKRRRKEKIAKFANYLRVRNEKM